MSMLGFTFGFSAIDKGLNKSFDVVSKTISNFEKLSIDVNKKIAQSLSSSVNTASEEISKIYKNTSKIISTPMIKVGKQISKTFDKVKNVSTDTYDSIMKNTEKFRMDVKISTQMMGEKFTKAWGVISSGAIKTGQIIQVTTKNLIIGLEAVGKASIAVGKGFVQVGGFIGKAFKHDKVRQTASSIADLSKAIGRIGKSKGASALNTFFNGITAMRTTQMAERVGTAFNTTGELTNSMEAQFISMNKEVMPIIARLGIFGKEASKVRSMITSTAFGLNVGATQVAEAYAGLKTSGKETIDMFKSMGLGLKDLVKLEITTGVSTKDLAHTASSMRKSWGMNDKQISTTLNMLAKVSVASGRGGKAFSDLIAVTDALTESYSQIGKQLSPEEIGKIAVQTEKLAGVFVKAIGDSPEQAGAKALTVMKAIASEQVNMQHMMAGLGNEFTNTFTEMTKAAGFDSTKALFEQNDPMKLVKVYQKVWSQLQKDGNTNAMNRFSKTLASISPDLSYLVKNGERTSKAMMDMDKSAKNAQGALRGLSKEGFTTGRTLQEEMDIMRQSFDTNIRAVSKGMVGTFVSNQAQGYKTLTGWVKKYSSDATWGGLVKRFSLVSQVGLHGLFIPMTQSVERLNQRLKAGKISLKDYHKEMKKNSDQASKVSTALGTGGILGRIKAIKAGGIMTLFVKPTGDAKKMQIQLDAAKKKMAGVSTIMTVLGQGFGQASKMLTPLLVALPALGGIFGGLATGAMGLAKVFLFPLVAIAGLPIAIGIALVGAIAIFSSKSQKFDKFIGKWVGKIGDKLLSIGSFIGNLDGKKIAQGVVNSLKGVVQAIGTFFGGGDAQSSAGKGFSKFLRGAWSLAVNSFNFAGQFLSGLFDGLSSAFDSASIHISNMLSSSITGGIKKAMSKIGKIALNFGEIILKGFRAIGNLADMIGEFLGKINWSVVGKSIYKGFMIGLGWFFVRAVPAILKLAYKLVLLSAKITGGITEALFSIFGQLGKSIGILFYKYILKPIGKYLIGLGKFILDGFVTLFTDIIPNVLKSIWKFFASIVNGFTKGVVDSILVIGKVISYLAVGIWNGFLNLGKLVGNGITTAFSAIWNTFKFGVLTFATGAINFASLTLNWLGNQIGGVIGRILSYVGNLLGSIGTYMYNGILSGFNYLASKVGSLANYIGSIVNGIFSGITGFFGKIGGWIYDRVAGLADSIGGGIGVAKDALLDVGRSMFGFVWDGAKQVFGGLTSWIGNAWSTVKNKLSSMASSVGGWISDILGSGGMGESFEEFKRKYSKKQKEEAKATSLVWTEGAKQRSFLQHAGSNTLGLLRNNLLRKTVISAESSANYGDITAGENMVKKQMFSGIGKPLLTALGKNQTEREEIFSIKYGKKLAIQIQAGMKRVNANLYANDQMYIAAVVQMIGKAKKNVLGSSYVGGIDTNNYAMVKADDVNSGMNVSTKIGSWRKGSKGEGLPKMRPKNFKLKTPATVPMVPKVGTPTPAMDALDKNKTTGRPIPSTNEKIKIDVEHKNYKNMSKEDILISTIREEGKATRSILAIIAQNLQSGNNKRSPSYIRGV